MIFYKDLNGNVHALSIDDILAGGEVFLPKNCVKISETDAQKIINKTNDLTIEQQRANMVMSNAQARLKLIKLGLFDAIDKAILSMPRNAPLYVLWEYGTNFHRTDEHLTAFCIDTLKMTAEEIDALFM